MKKAIIAICAFGALLLASCAGGGKGALNDGIYQGETRSKYASEPFYANAFLTVTDRKPSSLSFYIIDRQNDEIFDQRYEHHYAGNVEYVNQCRKDWAGIQRYLAEFKRSGDLGKVDSISGATWSFNLFKDAVSLALEKAKKGK